MMKNSLYLLSLLIILTAFTGADVSRDYPQDYFTAPVNTALRLSGTFGELRPNHFHAGIDIKGSTGVPILAVGEGHISRIKCSANGYGNVLYMRHPNGFTSVYAHLDQFHPDIAEYVKRKQYEHQKFEIELFPKPDQFRFNQGERIGKMGTTGRSFGPHLHFEMRDTRTEKPINPLLFGYRVPDARPPKMHQLKVYQLNDQRETLNTQIVDLVQQGKRYGVRGDTLNVPAWRTGLALKVYDHMDGVSNWNGIYALKMFVNDQPAYDFTMETFAFHESRYINAHLDYAEQQQHKAYFNRCFALPGNRLSIYDHQVDHGIIPLSKERATKVRMVAEDAAGNATELLFWVKRSEVVAPERGSFNYVLPYDEKNVIDNGALSLTLPEGSLYDNLYLQYQSAYDPSHGIYSSVHHLHRDKTVPLHQYVELGIRPVGLPADLRDKAFVAKCEKDNAVVNCGGEWKGEQLVTKVRSFGDYCIMTDDVPPTIEPIALANNMKGYNRMSFKIFDNYATAGNVRGLRYEGRIDGQWVLFEYDGKKDLITHYFDERTGSGSHQLDLTVTDALGNVASLQRTFTR